MGIIIGEFIQEETEIRSDFDDMIEEEVVSESLIKNDAPNDIKKLGENINS